MDKNNAKQIKIKAGTLKRYTSSFLINLFPFRIQKDYQSYAKETKQLEEKLDKLKEDGAEEVLVNKQN
jgi:tubulin-specific chaperone A